MNLHIVGQQVYDTYCARLDHGALALVRPDGIVCVTTALEDSDEIGRMLRQVLKRSCYQDRH